MMTLIRGLTLFIGFVTVGLPPAAPQRKSDSHVSERKPYRGTVVSIERNRYGRVEVGVKFSSTPKRLDTFVIDSICTARGKELSESEGFRRLRVGASVLVSADEGMKVSARYLQDVSRDTLVLIRTETEGSGDDEPVVNEKRAPPKMKKSPTKGSPVKQVPKN